MTTTGLRSTPLHAEHVALGGRMVPFAGWEMPVQYTGIVDEHRAVRSAAGLFDVSHMLRVEVRGPRAVELLRRALTWDVRKLAVGRGHYALMCEPDGGIRDDVFVYRTADDVFLFIGNASNAAPDYERLLEFAGPGAEVTSRHTETAMVALQGPRAQDIVARFAGPEVAAIKQRVCLWTEIAARPAFVARTGYTGEDGFELVVDAGDAPMLWRTLIDGGASPVGLGARDTLRLEAALVLYGNDIDRTTNPFEAGLGWVIDFDDDGDFVCREALRALHDRPLARRLVCLRAEERGVMRHGHAVLRAGRPVGEVTSGTFSPTLDVSIGMAYVEAAASEAGTLLSVDVRGKPLAVRVVPRPFYRRERGV